MVERIHCGTFSDTTYSQMYRQAQQFNHKSLLNHSDIQAARECTAALMPHVAPFPKAIFLPSISSCLFVYSTSEVEDCPGLIQAQTHRPHALQRLASCYVQFLASIILCTYMHLWPSCKPWACVTPNAVW